jgi:hypothetical protein
MDSLSLKLLLEQAWFRAGGLVCDGALNLVICVYALAVTDREYGKDGSLNMARRADVVSIYPLRAYNSALVGLFWICPVNMNRNGLEMKTERHVICGSACLGFKFSPWGCESEARTNTHSHTVQNEHRLKMFLGDLTLASMANSHY